MFLALRSVSLLCGMAPLLQPARRDSCDVLVRSLLESTDLLMHFRFDDGGTRKKIEYWFAGKTDNAWKADHNKCEKKRESFAEAMAPKIADYLTCTASNPCCRRIAAA